MARTKPGRHREPTPPGKPSRASPLPQPAKDRVRPWLLGAACGLWVVRPLYPSEGAALRGDGLPVVMLWLALAVFWFLGAVGRRRAPTEGWSRLRFGWIDAGLLLAVGLHTISALWATTHASPRPAVNMLWEWIGFGVGFFLTRQLVGSPREARAVVAVMAAVAVALACYGPYQTYVEMAPDRQLNRENQDKALKRAGLWYAQGAPERETFTNRLESMEPLATFALTNSLAAYLAPWLVVMLGIGVSAMGVPSKGRRAWLVGLGVVVLPVAGCLLLTKSRSGYLATLAGIAILAFGTLRHRIRIPWRAVVLGGLVVALLVAAAIALGGLDMEAISEATKSLSYRFQYWQSTAEMIAEHPLLGCGPGNFQDAYKAYKLPEASEEVADPHNFLLEVWSTAGTPTMLAFVTALGGFFWVVLRSGADDAEGERGRRGAGEKAIWRDSPLAGGGEQTALPVSPSPRLPRSPSPPPPATRYPRPQDVDRPLFVLGGGLAGFLAALPIAMLTGAPARYAVLYMGLPAAIATGAILVGWVDRGRMSAGLPAVGLAVLLIDLMTSGGIGYASVAGTLWILAALGLSEKGTGAYIENYGQDGISVFRRQSAHSLHLTQYMRLSPLFAAGLLAMTIGLAASCYWSGYDPVLRYHAAMESALQNPVRRVEYLRAAASADPLSAEPWNALAGLALAEWQQTADAHFPKELGGVDAANLLLRLVGQYTAAAIQRAPNDCQLRSAAASRYDAVFERTKNRVQLQRGIEHYQAAIRLYPNKAEYHARLALDMVKLGDSNSANEEAETALWLDDANPHRDKKLDPKLRKSMERIVSKRN